MKRMLSMVVAIALIISLINTTVFALDGDTLNITANSQSVEPGSTVTVALTVTANPGFGWLSITPICNDGITWKAQNGELSLDIDKGAKNINWSADEDCAELGVLATLSITVATDVKPGDYEITFRVNECYNENYDDVSVIIPNVLITVSCPHSDTTDVPEESATCNEGGYTAGVWCNDCQTYISGHEPIPATGNHVDTDDTWESDEVNHFRTCACGHIFDTAGHSGGTATCTQKAQCEICGKEYGQINANNHAGGTTVINASEPNHKTQTDGYTGDTKCLGCNEMIAYGQPIPADAHTPANVWSNDSAYHWKECTVVGCGIVIDGSKAPHISEKGENKATCQKQAVCDVCGVSYGELASHNYTAEDKNQDALKTAGNCRDNAVYYYSCSVCGLVENNDSHTFNGDKATNSHVGGTTLVNHAEANHKLQTDGYTGDTECLGCNEIIGYGQNVPAGAHIPASNWSADGTDHWKVCAVENCGVVIESTKTKHTATGTNAATCKTQAVCDVCETAHGLLNANNHIGGTTTVNSSEPDHNTQTDGYTGDTKCLGCGEIIAYGQTISAGAHIPAGVWSNDETHHWKECTVVGCGIVIDGSKAEHTSTGSNLATCQKKAVCDVCKVAYGDFAIHDWNTDSWESNESGHWHKCNTEGCAEQNAFENHTPDRQGSATEEYAIKCTVCQYEIEAQLGHSHLFDQEVVSEQYLASKANCTESAKYYKSCKCGERGTETFASGEALGHTEGTEWKCDTDCHWHECAVAGCGVVIDNSKAAHTPDREAATETDAVKCSVCGYVITPALGHTHAHGTDWKSDKDNHWNECACGDKANTAAHKDENEDGKCDVCAYNVGIPTTPTEPSMPSDIPQTGDNSMMWLWLALLFVSGFGMIATTVIGKKRFVR